MFTESSHHAGDYIIIEAKKAKCFEQGLQSAIRERIHAL